MKLIDLIKKGSLQRFATATPATPATVATHEVKNGSTVATVSVADTQKQAAKAPPVKSLDWLTGGKIGEQSALTTRLMTEAMLYCDRQGDTPAARQAMREQVLQTPDHQQADLLEHFIYQRRGAVVTTPSTSPPPPRRPELPPEPSPEPQAWRELAKEYHLHHFACHQCQAAGRGTQYGRRCAVGLALWTPYADTAKTK